METEVVIDLIQRRDQTIRDLDRYLPNTMKTILDGGMVTLFDGITMRKIEATPIPQDPSDYYNDSRKEVVVFAVKNNDTEEYFRVLVEYDSWDNGQPDEWTLRAGMEKVQKVPVERYEWKVVN